MSNAASGTILPLTDEQNEDLSAWRAWALALMPYFSHVLFAFRPMNVPGLGTFACDDKLRLYIDFDAVRKWGTAECAEVLLHECGHIFGEHQAFAREWALGPAERKVWNAAGDMSINDDLADAGCTYIPETGLMPASIGEPDHETARHYFDALIARIQQQQQASQSQQGQQGQSGQNQPGQDGEDEDGEDEDGESGQPGQNQPGQDGEDEDGESGQSGQGKQQEPFSGCGSVSGGEPAPCELDPDDDAGGNAPAANAAEIESVIAATAATILEAASSGRGTVPGGLIARARGFLTPAKVPWQRVLSAHVRRAVRLKAGEDTADHSKRDRRRHSVTVGGKKVIFPGRATPAITLAVVRDTSGSMGAAELDRATSEIVGIAKAMRVSGEDLKILDVDAALHATRKFRRAADIADVAGRGGTDMCVGIAKALELKPRPAAVIVISDGGTPWPTEKSRIPVIACLVGSYAASSAEYVPSWIKTVVVDEDD